MKRKIVMRDMLAAALYSGASLCVMPPATAQTPGKAITVEIPAGKLSTALNALAARLGLQIGIEASLVRERTTSGLSGSFTPSQAISRLLRGTGLQYRFLNDKVVTITATPQASVEAEGTELEPIIVSGAGFGRFNGEKTAAYDQAQSAYFVDEETISRLTGSSPSDILKGIPGVYTGEARTGGGIDPNIRGLQGQKRVKVTVDGAENSIDVYRGYAGRQERNYIDPDLISSVSVFKGPSPALDAIGGTIAMSTIGPQDILIEGNEIGVRLRGSVASNSASLPDTFNAPENTDRNSFFEPQTGNGSAAFALGQENFDVVGAYAKRHNGNYFAGSKGRDKYRIFQDGREENSVAKLYPDGGEVFNTSSQTESALFKLTLRPFEDHTLDLGYRYFNGRMGEIMSSQILRNSTGSIPQWDPSTVKSDSVTARYRWNPQDNDLIDLTANFAYSHLAYDGYLTLSSQTPSDRPACNDDPFSERCYKRFYGASRIMETTSVDIANTSKVDTEIGQFKINYGAALRFEKLFPPSDAPSEANGRQVSGNFHQQADREQFDSFGTVTWEPDERLDISLGGRFTKFKTYDYNKRREEETYTINRKSLYFYKNETEYDFLVDGDGNLVPDGNGWYLYDYSLPLEIRPVPRGNAFWYSDAQGNYTDATDPRKMPDGKGYPVGHAGDDSEMTSLSSLDFDDNLTLVESDQWSSEGKRTIYYDNLRRRNSGFAPSLSGSYEVFDGWKLHAAYTHGIRMPSLTESMVGNASAAVPADLRPEQARNLEFGVSTKMENLLEGGDSFMARLSYFNNKTKDYITRHEYYNEGSYRDPALRRLARQYNNAFYNADSFTVKGLELQATYDNGTFFTDFSATYNLSATTCAPDVAQFMRTMSSDSRLKNIPGCVDGGFSGSFTNAQNPPQYTLTGTFGARFLDEALEIATRVTHTSAPITKLDKPWNNFGGVATQLFYQPVTLFDLSASYKISENATAGFSIENVFDRYYIDPLSLSMMPGPGRTFKASLTMMF
ncbi:TonB-dependent receptor [Agrobacterium tumefaciens]|uniref:TonB-dependent receptor n=1 Tax=Agrobacterium tumefaciens TaxID=358 RepID=UPI001572B06A|nr:TonB-dependent receptor [Agrobacterium tumefaciens]NSX85541.1 TonB-dependent receptor [Agrobacterium tumefaciens]